MKCRWNFCKLGGEVDEEEAIERKKGYYLHKQCDEAMDQKQKIKDLYNKYINDKESWSIIEKTLKSWIPKYGVEYILFCVYKVIKNKIYIKNFLGLYYILSNKKYIDEYEKFKNGNKDPSKLHGEFVFLSESEYYKLLKELGEYKAVFYIKKLDKYIKSTGKDYTSHYETILLWRDRDDESKPVNTGLTIHGS